MNNRYIALLRGINVSGHKKIKMADLRNLLNKAGFQNIQTYIQSGNIVFDSFETEKTILENQISQIIKEDYGFDVPVLVMNGDYLKAIIENNPFLNENPDLDITKLCVTFLAEIQNEETKLSLGEMHYPPDEFHIGEKEIYCHCPDSFAETKLTNNLFEKKLKTRATTRNWRTVNKLFDMSQRE